MTTGRLVAIWRHPLKGHGREALEAVDLVPEAALPFDRHWAVLQEGAAEAGKAGREWIRCINFMRGAKAPTLQAMEARLSFEGDVPFLSLTHPERPPIRFNPDDAADAARFLDWVRPLYPADRPGPTRIIALPGRGNTDSPFPSIAIHAMASLRALSEHAGRPLSPLRFRGNLWLEGLAPWEEFDLVGKRIRIGGAELVVEEPIGRCRATTADPETGRIDFDTLALLERLQGGERNFGVYARVVAPGPIRKGDEMEVLG